MSQFFFHEASVPLQVQSNAKLSIPPEMERVLRCSGSGLNDLGVKSIIDSNAKKVIYVSCNPITLARDLNELKKKYDLKEVFVLDMFPYTYHCESIALLELK